MTWLIMNYMAMTGQWGGNTRVTPPVIYNIEIYIYILIILHIYIYIYMLAHNLDTSFVDFLELREIVRYRTLSFPPLLFLLYFYVQHENLLCPLLEDSWWWRDVSQVDQYKGGTPSHENTMDETNSFRRLKTIFVIISQTPPNNPPFTHIYTLSILIYT